ncbi:putative DNA primase/helicase [Ruminococcus flavefaciens]|uniref:Putative DNA primase/helicase n=1 Tax=Ruminococcus flavefaciens TaxID=1265 RepID=A0A1H6L1U0_RUMFL|nr:phage/plasmid primase, P4 family [Ruminococcus flavefaciens]SEH78178.1 putative DNA primase/helicase [Ruminococcus flavefaciens]
MEKTITETNTELSAVTYDDILNNTETYEKILMLPDEFAISQYITALRQIAKKFKLTSDFDRLAAPYKEKALRKLKEAAHQEKTEDKSEYPKWWDGLQINEDMFCTELLSYLELSCINGIFYDNDGEYPLEELNNLIYRCISQYVTKNVADRTKRLVEAMKIKCYRPAPVPDEKTIHVKNGTLHLSEGHFEFSYEKKFTLNRLDINYELDAPKPERWLSFVRELLNEQDVLTLQEYMGYLMIPSTRAQKMLMISGNGGEGKSRIGKVLFEIMGYKNSVSGSVSGLDNGAAARFNKVKLLGKLCMIDDDMDMSALEKTEFLKQLITAEIPMEIEPKGSPSFQALLYTRVIAFGNTPLSALYDRSQGFFRRQMILIAKPVPKDRVNDKHLIEKLLAEKEGIFLWCLEGLERLIANDFEFTISDQAKENLRRSERESNNIIPFMESEHDFKYDAVGQIHSQELYWAYQSWCRLNSLDELSRRTFTGYLKSHADDYNITYTENAVNEQGRRARGFIGMRYTYRPPTIMY